MTTQGRSSSQRLAHAIRLLLVLSFVNLLNGRLPASAARTQGGAQQAGQASARAAGGLHTTTFDTLHGRVLVHLPYDMRAGDTISGTVVAEPKGQTEDERAKNLAELQKHYKIKFDPVANKTEFIPIVPPVSFPEGDFVVIWETIPRDRKDVTIELTRDGKTQGRTSVPFRNEPPEAPRTPPSTTNNFQLPTIGQQGRPIEIPGPFDGDVGNTTLNFNPVGRSTVQDFEKGAENVSGGSGLIYPLAESPRKIVFESPTDFTGPAEIVLKEGNVEARGPYRSVGVRLGAEKLSLLRGERTTLTIEASGLQGIKEMVPLQLDSKGVISMEGGNFQYILIQPSDVRADGRYTTTRPIIGEQAGGFSVTATVVVNPFDKCIQPDPATYRGGHLPDGIRMIENEWIRRIAIDLSTFTGEYRFRQVQFFVQQGADYMVTPQSETGGYQYPQSSTSHDGSTQQWPIIGLEAGKGKVTRKGCIILLTHNAPDRRVMARLDVCNNTGSAEVQTTSPKRKFNITDSNTADNVCSSK